MNFFKSVALAAGMVVSAVAADAATYNLERAINGGTNFITSGFHTQTNGRMSGPFIDMFDDTAAATTGQWTTDASVTGNNIWFTSKLQGGASVSAIGRINFESTRTNGLDGFLEFMISGSGIADFDGAYRIVFDDNTFVGSSSNPVANGLKSTSNSDVFKLGLWGDRDNYPNCTHSNQPYECVGLDLRLKARVTDDDFNIPPVPLPAAGWLLLAGLGSLAAARRKKS